MQNFPMIFTQKINSFESCKTKSLCCVSLTTSQILTTALSTHVTGIALQCDGMRNRCLGVMPGMLCREG